MPKYFIEVPHEPEISACIRAVEAFLSTGSHFLTNAEWGCEDGVHKAWIILDAEDKEQARMVVPPNFRAQANIVQLNKFDMQDLEELRKYHQGS
jgi:hypothetical protein